MGNYLGHDIESEIEQFNPVGMISSSRTPFDELTGLSSSDLSDDEIDLMRPDYYRAFTKSVRNTPFIKTHDKYHRNDKGEWLFPADASQAAVYLVRNPLDVAVSYAHHGGHGDYAKTIGNMNDPSHFLAGGVKNQIRQKMGSWSDHFLSWNDQREIPIILVKYEDMLADTAGQLQRVVEFCGMRTPDDETNIVRAVENSEFQKLQKKEKDTGFRERPVKAQRFFRSGRSGEGEEKLSDELKQSLINENKSVMVKLGYV